MSRRPKPTPKGQERLARALSGPSFSLHAPTVAVALTEEERAKREVEKERKAALNRERVARSTARVASGKASTNVEYGPKMIDILVKYAGLDERETGNKKKVQEAFNLWIEAAEE